MSSSSPSDSPARRSPYARELIEKEIEHLRKPASTRHGAGTERSWWKFIVTCVVLALVALWGLDTVLFSYNRGDAIHVYLYLHNYGADAKAQAVANSGLLSLSEVKQLNARQGSFQDFFSGTEAAEKRGMELIAYMQEVEALHDFHYDMLSPLNKVRYFLFMKTGLIPPRRWDVLNSSLDK